MKLRLTDNRFTPFRERIVAFYTWRWQQECAWDGSESNQLARLLKACPKLDVNTFSRWLYNYGLSDDIAPGERPREFLPRIHRYSQTHLDRFGRDPNAKTGETFADRDSSNTAANARRVLENLERNGANGQPHRQTILGSAAAAAPRRPRALPSSSDRVESGQLGKKF